MTSQPQGPDATPDEPHFETTTGILERYRRTVENETNAGLLLLLGAAVALLWANSPWRGSYQDLAAFEVGVPWFDLTLSLGHWASDGLLAIFFFVVGMELKSEFVTGSLRDPRKALVPILAAVCGVVGPVAFYSITQLVTGSGEFGGWAIPVATDIAFALAVLSVFGKGVPVAARVFLLTLAVVDDLIGIILIAVFFAGEINVLALLGAAAGVVLFAVLVRLRVHPAILWPVGIATWVFMHSSGIHATIAGVVLGMMVTARPRDGEEHALTHRYVGALNVYSAGLILPIFAFFAAGVSVVDSGGLGAMLADPVAVGIYLGLPVGKYIGIFGGVALMIGVFRLRLGDGLHLRDIGAVALVAGVGFTVSLLIAQLSFSPTDPHEAHARVAVLLGSLIAALVGGGALRVRARHHGRRRREHHERTGETLDEETI
ncbi:MAG: Na+/H+ antiporter NhaA [Actinomycetaceae bacterium]